MLPIIVLGAVYQPPYTGMYSMDPRLVPMSAIDLRPPCGKNASK